MGILGYTKKHTTRSHILFFKWHSAQRMTLKVVIIRR